MPRATDLPEFGRPPINELVLGVQFPKPEHYQLIYAKDIYSRFAARYPTVQEQAPLPPNFETFGSPQTMPNGAGFSFEVGPRFTHPRFWFLDVTGHQLLQFQQDKFFHNWRQVDGLPPTTYPRFKAIRQDFRAELVELEDVFKQGAGRELLINQVEVSYYNRIYDDSREGQPRPDEWLKFVDFGEREPEAFNGTYRELVRDSNGKPVARAFIDLNSAFDGEGRPMLLLALTVRGAPPTSSIDAALEFMDFESDFIVKTFADMTTEEAHKKWQRTR